jgi:hypothetical protein
MRILPPMIRLRQLLRILRAKKETLKIILTVILWAFQRQWWWRWLIAASTEVMPKRGNGPSLLLALPVSGQFGMRFSETIASSLHGSTTRYGDVGRVSARRSVPQKCRSQNFWRTGSCSLAITIEDKHRRSGGKQESHDRYGLIGRGLNRAIDRGRRLPSNGQMPPMRCACYALHAKARLITKPRNRATRVVRLRFHR